MRRLDFAIFMIDFCRFTSNRAVAHYNCRQTTSWIARCRPERCLQVLGWFPNPSEIQENRQTSYKPILRLSLTSTDAHSRNDRNLQISKAKLKSQARGTSLFTSATSNQRGCPEEV